MSPHLPQVSIAAPQLNYSKIYRAALSLLNRKGISLFLFFLFATGTRLFHASNTYLESGHVFPAGGIPGTSHSIVSSILILEGYEAFSNLAQNSVRVHVVFCIVWAALAAFQFLSGITIGLNRSKIFGLLHTKVGYGAIAIAFIAAATGRYAVEFLRLPSYVLEYLAFQLRHGAPGFAWETIWGVCALKGLNRSVDLHYQHMRLALFGTLADAGNGFLIHFSRVIASAIGYQDHQAAQDLAVLTLNWIAVLPWLYPPTSPHMQHIKNRYAEFFHGAKPAMKPGWDLHVRDLSALISIPMTIVLISNTTIGIAYLVTHHL